MDYVDNDSVYAEYNQLLQKRKISAKTYHAQQQKLITQHKQQKRKKQQKQNEMEQMLSYSSIREFENAYKNSKEKSKMVEQIVKRAKFLYKDNKDIQSMKFSYKNYQYKVKQRKLHELKKMAIDVIKYEIESSGDNRNNNNINNNHDRANNGVQPVETD
eukprot:445148_1